MKILIALGGNALLKRGQKPSAQNQINNVKEAVSEIVKLIPNHQIIITHGNGPQVGLLALQSNPDPDIAPYPFDVLGSQTQGMIGYMIQQELYNLMPSKHVVSLITRVQVDPNDPAFKNPAKPIGPVYDESTAQNLAEKHSWSIMQDGKHFRRAIASPKPQKIIELHAIKSLMDQNIIPVCAGGGGIPVQLNHKNEFVGVEAVIDKDLCSSLLASLLKVDLFIIASDVEAVFLNWGTPQQSKIAEISLKKMAHYDFPAGSMKPKVDAALDFVRNTGFRASIGSLQNIQSIVSASSGTHIIP